MKVALSPRAARCRRKFLRYFPRGFRDPHYVETEREYKWETHLRWQDALPQRTFKRLLADGAFEEIAARAVRVEQQSLYSSG